MWNNNFEWKESLFWGFSKYICDARSDRMSTADAIKLSLVFKINLGSVQNAIPDKSSNFRIQLAAGLQEYNIYS